MSDSLSVLGLLAIAALAGVFLVLTRPEDEPDDREAAQQRMREWLDEHKRGGDR